MDQCIRGVKGAVGIAAAVYVVVYVVLAIAHLRFPFELEWIEGSLVDYVQRVLDGKPLYAPPSLEFCSYEYTPFHYYVCALVCKVFGVNLFSLRLVSFLASLGVFAFLVLLVRHETGSVALGLFAAGLYAATYDVVNGWFDLARIDSLYMLLLLAAIYVGRVGKPCVPVVLLTGLLFFLAFFTKQTALLIAGAFIVYYLFVNWRLALLLGATLAVAVGASTALLDYLHGGWYLFYTFSLLTQHDLLQNVYTDFWTKELFPSMPIACILGALFVARLALTRNKDVLFYGALALGMIGSSWLIRLHSGSSPNALISAFAILAILMAIATHRVLERSKCLPRWGAYPVILGIAVLCAVQLYALRYTPRFYLPRERNVAEGEALVRYLRETPGEVWVVSHGYFPALAGKKSYAHICAVWEFSRGAGLQLATELHTEIEDAFRNHKFAAVLIGMEPTGFVKELAQKYYRKLDRRVYYYEDLYVP